MLNLYDYISKYIILEGGAAGHMAHPFDYNDLSKKDIIELIENLFSGKIENITEKIDGTNIQATMNPQGEVVFIRNKGDLNSTNGGMTISDMALKWSDKPAVANTFISAGKIIKDVFNNIGVDFFNPDPDTKILVNCECVIAGVTNIMPYPSDRVNFHDLWIYNFNGTEWVKSEVTKKGLEVINNACKGIEKAMITPNVLINVTNESTQLSKKFISKLDNIMGNNDTIGEFKKYKFKLYIEENYPWILDNKDGMDILFNRWFMNDKKINIRDIKKIYPEYTDIISTLDKIGYKTIVNKCVDELDIFFLRLGNAILKLCRGLVNNGLERDVIDYLNNELTTVSNRVKSSANINLQDKLSIQLTRLKNLENQINSSEGIVFIYKDKTMKLTGSFAALNQILGGIKYNS